MTDSESDDEVVIHNPSHSGHLENTVAAAAAVVDGCEKDNMTLLALAKPAMARNRSKRKAQAARGGKPQQAAAVTTQAQPPTIPVTLSIEECYSLSDEELLKIYKQKVSAIPLGQATRFEDLQAADELSLGNMDLYTEMLTNAQEAIMSVAKELTGELHVHQSNLKAMKDSASGEQLYSEEQCRAANADAAQQRQAAVEADLERKAAEAVLAGSGDSCTQSPIPPVYARAVATGNAERDEACQIIAHMLAPDYKLLSKACAIEEAIFRLWGSSGVKSEYRQRVHALLRLLCPEGLPGVFCAANTTKRRKVEGAQSDGTTSQNSATSELGTHRPSQQASQVRGQLWSGSTNIVKLVSDL
eukprot:jgi/Ulvmu1/231/UM001_0235.1